MLRGFLDAVYVMAYRQVKHFVRSPSRIIGSIVNPLIWIVFFGLGWAKAFNNPFMKVLLGGLDYLSFLVPGVIAMSVFTGSFLSGISVIFDKQFGFLKEILVAPTPRSAAILGRILGDSLTAMVQAALIALVSIPFMEHISVIGTLVALIYGYFVAIGFSALGVAIASRMRSHEGFQLIMSFLILPLLFLSGAFYPVSLMPTWMKVLAYLDPLTYGVDAMRYWMTGVSWLSPITDLAALVLLDTALVGFAAMLFNKMTIE
ncbi:ABC transporter permease [Pyrofollis japonicus]|uniref:ABC transporter permease n=1 Tax=Pyrofollis japonicus TaxID=3060460 RepID=UPI00295BC211|nr:ABC transporter permease [Pyrofollis japonicus]BEP17940.1 ABC transporter permease [Pyrofollis japonicus]